MKFYDIIILIFLGLCAFTGFKRGVFKSLVMFVGAILVLVFAYWFKNIVGDFLALNLPFIEFGQLFKGTVAMNIVMYQAVGFILMIIIFSLVYRILITLSGIFEKILKFTIVLSIPSKLLGLLFGVLEGIVILYMTLFFFKQPFLNINLEEQSDYANIILTKTPILSAYAEKSLAIYNEIRDLTKIEDKNELDLQMMDVILKEKVASKEIVQKLIDQKKLNIDGIEAIMNKY